MIDISALSLGFRDEAGSTFPVLDIPELSLPAGRLVVVSGPSGSGKSTLLHVLAGLLRPDSGTVTVAGVGIHDLSESRRDRWRRETIGFVFQDFHLIDELSPRANVTLPLDFGSSRSLRKRLSARADLLLERLGVPKGRTRTALMSRGERQRTAIARALLFDPPIFLADEPTASLDVENARQVRDHLQSVARAEGRLVVAVSHDPLVMEAADTLYRLDHGRLVLVHEAAAAKLEEMPA